MGWGLGGGYQPIGAILCTQKIHDAVLTGSGFFQHGHTYLGHPVACAAALAVLERLVDDDVLACVEPAGEHLRHALRSHLGQHPHVGDIRGVGLFCGVELVADRATKEPFAPSKKLHAKIKATAFAEGLICYPMGGTIDGQHGDHVLLAPPFIASNDHLDAAVEKLASAINKALDAS